MDERALRQIGRGVFSGPGGSWRALEWPADYPPVTRWKLWYKGGITADSETSAWDDCPAYGVQCLVVWAPGPCMSAGYDEYRHPSGGTPKYGEMIDETEHTEIYEAAMSEIRS